MASDHLPDDLLPQILKNLPVKTLIKFQCVCKSWKSLLSSRFFTDVQLKYTTKSGGAPTYLRQVQQKDTHKALYVIEQGNTRTNVDFPMLQSKRHHVMSLKVIHGVVCLAYAFMIDRSRVYSRKNVSFWNPIVRKHVTSSTPFESGYNFYGFGFDASKNDFKAVWSPIKSVYCEVFSARDGKWMKTKQPEWVDSQLFGIDSSFINGTLHWATYPKSGSSRPHGLLLFECEREEFTSIELPELVGVVKGPPKVIEYRGLLSVLISLWRGVRIDWEFWTMNESTWTKTHTYCNMWTMSEFTCQLACDYKEIDIHMVDSSAGYVFKETMLLMDIGQSSQDTSVSFRPKRKRFFDLIWWMFFVV